MIMYKRKHSLRIDIKDGIFHSTVSFNDCVFQLRVYDII